MCMCDQEMGHQPWFMITVPTELHCATWKSNKCALRHPNKKVHTPNKFQEIEISERSLEYIHTSSPASV